jgi:ABC-2 type transport system permease protein
MSTMSYALTDSMTMLRRNLVHAVRYPSLTLYSLLSPTFFLLLFAGVFGGALGAGIGGATSGGSGYIDYVSPGIILIAAASGSVGTAISVSMDMTEGIINRFRTMPISRASVLTGHVVGSVIQTLVSIALVVGIALAMGFEPNASIAEWFAAAGVLTAVTTALTWLSAALGLIAKNVESASNLPMPFTLLPLVGSGFVPTDSMPGAVRWFAEYQPFTPMIETIRGLLMGTPIGDSAWVALTWCAVIGLGGYLWAKARFTKVTDQ